MSISSEEIQAAIDRMEHQCRSDHKEDWDLLAQACLENHLLHQNQQAQIDRLTAQNLQLRLIADRAVVIVLGGEKPDQQAMSEDQLKSLAAYMDSVNYDDTEEAESAEDMLIRLMVKPLLEIGKDSPSETNLLQLAMAEQNRKKLVGEEIQQLTEFAKLRPQRKDSAQVAVLALHFARQAGIISKETLVDLYSPVVSLARSLAK